MIIINHKYKLLDHTLLTITYLTCTGSRCHYFLQNCILPRQHQSTTIFILQGLTVSLSFIQSCGFTLYVVSSIYIVFASTEMLERTSTVSLGYLINATIRYNIDAVLGIHLKTRYKNLRHKTKMV